MSKLRVSRGDGHQEILKIFILHTITLRGFESRTLYSSFCSRTLNNGLNAPVAQSVERVAVKPPAGWWTKSVAYARVRVPSGAVLGPGRKIMDPGWGFLIQSFYFIEIII